MTKTTKAFITGIHPTSTIFKNHHKYWVEFDGIQGRYVYWSSKTLEDLEALYMGKEVVNIHFTLQWDYDTKTNVSKVMFDLPPKPKNRIDNSDIVREAMKMDDYLRKSFNSTK